jgi:hypothetical protein|tara:strand:+ start:1360 stop:1653 length:294 start_codon:yes stop_codon:yes gene_type:complete
MSDFIKRKNTPKKQQPDPVEKRKSVPFVFDDKGKKFFLKMNEKNQKPVIIIESGGKQKTGTMDTDGKIKFRKGGRAGLKGGGICKRGMNRDAVGKNS